MQVFNSFQEMTGTEAGVQSTMDVFNMEQPVQFPVSIAAYKKIGQI